MPERYLGRSLGRYQVLELVGAGGFAWVYRARDPDLEIDVALKVLKPHYASDEAVVDRFRREASTAARLRHPHIVTVLAVGREGDAPFVAMDFLPGSLAALLADAPALDERRLLRIGIHVAQALAYAHAAGVVHRDIKVDNILLDAAGNAVVADFGIARALADAANQSLGSQIVGTPQYFSPEQARGLPLDGRTDLYALGVTLYRAATGALPFVGDDWYAVMRQHIEVPAPSPRDANPRLTPATEEIILRCLEKDPDARFADADELCRALETAAAQFADGHDSRDGADTMILSRSAARRAVGRRQSTLRRVAPAVLVVGAVATAAALATARMTGERVALPTAVDSAGLLPPAPDTLVPGPANVPLVVTADTAQLRSDSVRTVTPPARVDSSASLLLLVPDDASVQVGGRRVTNRSGRARVAPIMTGQYDVIVKLATLPDCPSSVVTRRVIIDPSEQASLTLMPRPCGRLPLRIRGNTSEARFTVRDLDGRVVKTGFGSASSVIVLPAGRYKLLVESRTCVRYDSDITIPADGDAEPEFVQLLECRGP